MIFMFYSNYLILNLLVGCLICHNFGLLLNLCLCILGITVNIGERHFDLRDFLSIQGNAIVSCEFRSSFFRVLRVFI